MVPATVEPPEGTVMETAGVAISGLFTVTDTAVDVVWLPAASRATAVSVCVPVATVVVFRDIE